MKIELELPEIEGYEPDEGKQPRPPKLGEYWIDLDCISIRTATFDYGPEQKCIILRKKAPVYLVLDIDADGCTEVTPFQAAMGHRLVEIKALEDALKLTESGTVTRAEYDSIRKALKELLK